MAAPDHLLVNKRFGERMLLKEQLLGAFDVQRTIIPLCLFQAVSMHRCGL